MISVKHISLYSGLVVGVIAIAGCSTVEIKPDAIPAAESVVAQDFVNTMMQIDSLSPDSTVLLFERSLSAKSNEGVSAACVTDNFGQALQVAATRQGYTVQLANSKPSNVSFSADLLGTEQACTYDLTVGEVDFRRVYGSGENGKVTPYKSMLVRGADVSDIESDDSIFDQSNDSENGGQDNIVLSANAESTTPDISKSREFDSPVARNDLERRNAAELQKTAEPELAVVKSNKVSADNAFLSPDAEAEALGLTITTISDEVATVEVSETSVRNNNGFVNVRKKNIAESGLSNFELELSDKKNVAEEILIFGDDSYVLGARNKQLLGDMMGSFNPDTDVVSVVGCSTGVTQIENGNAALAIGRANRVKEALLYSGVPHDKIFEEGCWSPTPNSTPFPNRGVVITVKRAVDKG